MTRIITFAALVGGLLFASACGQAGGASDTSGTPELADSASSSTVMPTPAGFPPAMMPNLAMPDSRAVDLMPVRWNQADPSDTTVTVRYAATGLPGCQVLGRVDVIETETAVTITVMLGNLPEVDCTGPQPQVAADYATAVTLLDPVGTRAITDGAPA